MDLYKWSYKLSPLIDSETLLDCLELAAAAREIDMRASPYDLSDYGYAPIAVEDAAGAPNMCVARRPSPRVLSRCGQRCWHGVTCCCRPPVTGNRATGR
jgi:hypothetical protein